jgi:phage terminase small subunit
VTDKGLSERERLFVDAYLGPAKGVGAAACKAAGYKGDSKVLTVQAGRMLSKAHIKLEIATRRAAMTRSAIATADEVAVRLSGIGMGVVTEKRIIGGKDDFVEVDLPMTGQTQVAALKQLSVQMGYEAPTKTEVTGALAVEVSLSPEQESALASWLLIRDDPRVRSILEEYGA